MQAFACFASALNLAPEHAETLIACGTLYKNCGLLVEAVESYKLALKGTPDDMALREALAVALTDLGERRVHNPPEHITLREQVHWAMSGFLTQGDMEATGASPMCFALFPLRYLQLDLLVVVDAARNHRCSEVSTASDSVPFGIRAGTKLKTAGNVGEGMARYLEAVVVCPTYAAAFYNQGVVHSEQGRLDAATASYRRAVELLPAYAEAWCNLGVILRSQACTAVDAACVCALRKPRNPTSCF